MLVTSNRSVAEWGGVFGDAVVATAILEVIYMILMLMELLRMQVVLAAAAAHKEAA